jgi:TonB family protein
MIVLLLKVTLLFAVALAVQPRLRRSSAAIRHLVCACALAGALILPLTLLAPPRANAFRIDASTVAAASRSMPHTAAGWPLSEVLATIWAIGAAMLVLRIAVGDWTLARLLRTATPLDITLDDTRAAPMFFADISVPVVSGFFRPVILLPRSAEFWTAAHRNAALQHELQHVERKDLWTMLIAHLACAIYWFHPLAWVLARCSRHEQELACDDAVLASGLDPAAYAEALVAAARELTSTRLIGCHMLTRRNLKSRIARLFDSGLARIPSRAGLRGAVVASVAAVAIIGMMVGARPARAGDDQVYPIGNGVTQPILLTKVEADYTEEARAARLQGTVSLEAVFDEEGYATNIRVTHALGMGLDRKAIEALQQWVFQPGTKDGKPVRVRGKVQINFRLPPKSNRD